MQRLFYSVVVCLFAAVSARSATYFVRTGGNDACTGLANTDGASGTCAWKTISHGSAVAVAGDTVHVAAGTYTNSISTTHAGTSGSRITFISDTPLGAKIVVGGVNQIWFVTGDYVTIQGFDVAAPAGDTTVHIGIRTDASHTIIQFNNIHDINPACSGNAGAGIDAAAGNLVQTDIVTIGNVIHDIAYADTTCRGTHGIYYSSQGGGVIYNNIIYRISAFGIHNWHAAANITIANNLTFNCHASGIIVGNGDAPLGTTASNFLVVNNISMDNGEWGIIEEGRLSPSNTYTDNLVFRNTSGGIATGNAVGNTGEAAPTGTITLDPAFVSYNVNGGGDYHLTATSPAIDHGTSNGAPTTDFDGVTRPKGATWDIGPYEFSSPVNAAVPIVNFADITQGPNTGGDSNAGVYVTIYGFHFGSTRGTSTVKTGTGIAATYKIWTDTKISFQVGSAATTGDIVVTTPSGSSTATGFPFTIRSGNIRFVGPASAGCSDTNSGATAALCWLTLNRWLVTAGATAGDTVYVMNGFSFTGDDAQGLSASATVKVAGTATNRIQLLAYPGATAIIGGARDYGIRDNGSSPNWTIAGLRISGNAASAMAFKSDNWRIIGNEFTCPNCNNSNSAALLMSAENAGARIFGNTIDQVSTNVVGGSNKTFHSMWLRGNGHFVAYNNISNVKSYHGIEVFDAAPTGGGYSNLLIHDNDISDQYGSCIDLGTIRPDTAIVSVYQNLLHHCGQQIANGGASGDIHSCVSFQDLGTNPAANTNVEVYNNTLFDCSSYLNLSNTTRMGAIVKGSSSASQHSTRVIVHVQNNIIYQPAYTNTGSQNTYCDTNSFCTDIQGASNIWFGDTTSIPSGTTGTVADPLFLSTSVPDLHLQSASPGKNGGVTISTIAEDFDGLLRPQNTTYSRGVYEVTPSANVKTFGPTGTCGATNDSIAIQTAINTTTSGTLLFPAGCYKIGTPLNLLSGVRYLGQGAAVLQATGNTIFTMPVNADAIIIEGLTFDDGQLLGQGISTNLIISGNTFQNLTFYSTTDLNHRRAIYTGGSIRDSSIDHNTFKNILPNSLTRPAGNIDDPNFAIFVYGLDNTTIDHNTFDLVSEGIRVCQSQNYSASDVYIGFNTFTNIHRMAIEMQGAGGCANPITVSPDLTTLTIENNNITDFLDHYNNSFGISEAMPATDGCSGCVIRNNFIAGAVPDYWFTQQASGHYGIAIESAGLGLEVYNNQIRGVFDWAIGVFAGSTSANIHDNNACKMEPTALMTIGAETGASTGATYTNNSVAAGCNVTYAAAGDNIYPADSGLFSVKSYGAKGDGTTDDTVAIRAAIAAAIANNLVFGRDQTIYFPTGTYIISDTLWWTTNGNTPAASPNRNWVGYLRFEGQNRDNTTIRLKDNTFTTTGCTVGGPGPLSGYCKSMIYTANAQGCSAGSCTNDNGAGESGYKNDIWNLTINSGVGNPGAIGISWQCSNVCELKNVNIISGDGTGKAGLNEAVNLVNSASSGPGLVKNLSVQGFDYGIYSNNTAKEVGLTHEYIDLEAQQIAGVYNAGLPNWYRNVTSLNSVPAFVQCHTSGTFGAAHACGINSGRLLVTDAVLSNGSGATSAIIIENNQANTGGYFLRNVTTTGYNTALATGTADTATGGSNIAEGSFPAAQSTFGSPTASVNTQNIPNTPEFFDNNFGTGTSIDVNGFSTANCNNMGPSATGTAKADWADVTCYGAVTSGGSATSQTTAVQAAINSGRPVIYFPWGRYVLNTIHIPNTVRKIIGMKSYLTGNTTPLFSCENTTGNSVEIRNFSEDGTGNPAVINSCKGPLVIANIGQNMRGYQDSTANNTVFYEDVASPYVGTFSNSTAWLRQYDIEGGYPHFTNVKGWLFGFKTEDGTSCGNGAPDCDTLLTVTNSTLEIIGAAHYSHPTGNGGVEYLFTNSKFSVASFYSGQGWDPIIREVQAATTNNLAFASTGYAACCTNIGLYTSKASTTPGSLFKIFSVSF